MLDPLLAKQEGSRLSYGPLIISVVALGALLSRCRLRAL